MAVLVVSWVAGRHGLQVVGPVGVDVAYCVDHPFPNRNQMRKEIRQLKVAKEDPKIAPLGCA